MKVILLSVLLLALFLVAPLGHAGPFASRSVGVAAGESSLYDTWSANSHYLTNVTVLWVQEGQVGLNVSALSFDGGVMFSQAVTENVYCCGSQEPGYLISSGLSVGDNPYIGDGRSLQSAFLGHVVAGDFRSVLVADSSDAMIKFTHREEWDQRTGVLTFFLVESTGSGWEMKLISTNAWSYSPFWNAVGFALVVFWAALPWLAFAAGMYFLLFFFVAMKDWFHLRSLKARSSGKMGGMMWFQIKIMIIASLIIIGILILALTVLSLVLRG